MPHVPIHRRRRWWVEVLDALWTVPAWAIFALVVIGVPVGLLVNFTGPVLGYPVLILLIVLIPTTAITMRNIRQRRASAALAYVQQAFRLNLPLHRFLRAAADSEVPPLSMRLYRLQDALESGVALAPALSVAMPELPERSVALIEHAEQVGNIPETLDRLLEEQRRAARRRRPDAAMGIWYPPMLLILAGGLIYLMAIFIAPRYEDIFEDFHQKLPPLSQWIFDSVVWVQPVFLIIAAVFIAASGLQLRDVLKARRPSWLWLNVKARLLWFIPLAHAVIYDRALADVCTALADAVDAGRPIEQALLRAGQLDLPPAARWRLENWRIAVARGEPIDRAARSAGLPPLLSGMLNPAAGGSSLTDALRFLARYYADRSIVRREVARGIYLPLVTVIMGIVVACVAMGVFLPLRSLVFEIGGYWR